MNNQNLKPLSTSKAREIGRKGGKSSVKARKKRKYIKAVLEELMLLDLPECKLKENMRSFGITEDDMSIQNALCVSLVQSALNNNIKAFTIIQKTLGEDPKDGIVEPLQNIFFVNDIPSKLKEETKKLKEK